MSSAAAPAAPAMPAAAAEEPKLSIGLYIGYLAMVLGLFMAILDIQIVSSSISEIQAGLSASADEISWVQTSYLIAEVIMIPFSGYLSRLLSTRILFTLSALSFTLASIGCAMSNNLESMIVMRALQGFLGGAMIPTVFATVFIMFPPRKRAAASVTIGLIATLAPTIGPTLGGYLTQWLSWHWLFLINVVPGIVVCVLVWTFLDIDKPNLKLLRGFDYIGLAAMAVFLGSLEYVIEEGPRHDWLSEPIIRNFAIACVIGGCLFFWRSFTHKNPVVDMKAFRNRNFSTGCIFSFTMGIGLYGLVYLLPLFLARVRGLNSLQIGEIMFVTGLAQFLIAPVAGFLARTIDPRKVLLFGLLLMAASTHSMATITGDWQFSELLVPQIMRGMALMLCMVPINAIALGTLPPHEVKNAAGLYNLTRNLGGAFGLAAINTVLIDRNAQHWSRLIEAINPGRPEVQAYIDGAATQLAEKLQIDETLLAAKLFAAKVSQQASIMSFADCFYLLTILFTCAAFGVMLAKRPIPHAGGGDAH